MATSILEREPMVVIRTGRSLSTRFAAAVRWLHIYVSLFAFAALIFFGLTGITLNHPTWFGADAQHVVEHTGTVPLKWLGESNSSQSSDAAGDDGVAKLEIAEHLRSAHQLRGAVSEFRVDDRECLVLFKGPGYAADVVLDRASGTYTVVVTAMGLVAIMNDLHKGRDTGSAWAIVIDIVSLVTVFVSVTGLILILYIRRKRMAGILTTLAGTAALIAVVGWLIQ